MNNEYIMNRNKTNNSNLWSNCYWGSGGNACEEVINNRNEFAVKWKGIKYYKTHQRFKKQHHNNGGEYGGDFTNQYLDHSEYYILPDKRKMILFHPYCIEQKALDYVIENGFVMITELYAMGCYSFLKIV